MVLLRLHPPCLKKLMMVQIILPMLELDLVHLGLTTIRLRMVLILPGGLQLLTCVIGHDYHPQLG